MASAKNVRSLLGIMVHLGSVGVFGSLTIATAVEAQNRPVADPTLGIESSIVFPVSPTIDVVEGGAIRNQNLFHSFSEFNIGEGRGVYFFSPSPDIQTIFSRVTGINRSDILGTLGTFGDSAPNVWLINPNGILFGPNASLDIGGSFLATTANAVQVNDLFFQASDLPGNPQILTIDDSAFFMNELSDASIINQSQATSYATGIPINGANTFLGLQVLEGRSIGFVGQDIGFDNSFTNAPNGNILLFSTNTIELENDANVVSGNVTVAAGQVSVQGGSWLLAQFIDIARLSNNLQISPGNFVLTNPDEIQGLPTASGGNVSIVARESIDVSGTTPDEQFSSLIGTDAIGLLSSGGNISIQTPNLTIQNGGQISSSYISVSERNVGGGRISVTADSAIINGESIGGGRSSRLYIGDSPLLSTNEISVSPSNGSMFIQANEFSLLDGGEIGSSGIRQLVEPMNDIQPIPDLIEIFSLNTLISGVSQAGDPSNITTAPSSLLERAVPLIITSQMINLQEGGQINGDVISILGNSLSVQDNSQINGDINLSITDSITVQDNARTGSLDNLNQDDSLSPIILIKDNALVGGAALRGSTITVRDDSLIFGKTEIRGDSVTVQDTAWIVGNLINISRNSDTTENSVVLRDQSILFAGEIGALNDGTIVFVGPDDGDAINIIADSLTISDDSLVIGNIITLSGNDIVLQNQVQVRADEPEFGDGGNIDISTNSLRVLDSAQLSASVAGTGEGGDINIVSEGFVEVIGDPLSPEPSSISATLGGPGTGGQISIDTGSLTVQNGSQITTRVNGGGSGGDIDISARDAVTVQGTSSNGRPSSISAETDLNGGEFGILRHIKLNQQSRDNVFLLLESTSPQFFIGEGVLYAIPGRADEILGEENLVPFEGIDEAQLSQELLFISVTNSLDLNQPSFGLRSVVDTTAESLLLPDGLFMIGQSFGTNFDESISGGQIIDSVEEMSRLETFRQFLISGFEDSKNELVSRLSTFPFDDEAIQAQINEIDNLRESFEAGAGEFYVVESTGNEFRIQDDTFTDTRFLNIQPGDLFLIFAVRDGGDININTSDLIIRDGAQITTNSLGAAQGNSAASNLTINAANLVLVENNSSISATASTGSGGNLSIQTSDLQLNSNSTLSAAARANAGGGRVTIDATGDVRLTDSDVRTDSEQAGGGGIEINARDIYLEGDSDIRTNVEVGDGDGGDINLSGRYVFAFDDSDILANARDGRGGDITLDVQGFFGENFTLDSLNADPATLDGNDRVDINATGSVNGVVTIPNVNFIENSLNDLTENIIAPDQLFAGSCIARVDDTQGSFVVTGNGGLPTRPGDTTLSSYPTSEVQAPPAAQTVWQPGDPIIEPTQAFPLPDGRLVLSRACN
jgi:filamentous hemagglutinin family protein